MIICMTPEDLARDRKPQYGGRMIEMFGDRSSPWEGPCGHLVRQKAEDIVAPHFHEADQYQVFVAGSGRIGGHEVRTGSVHYADAYSGYGPIVPNAEGCSYMTLRPTFDKSHHPLPQEAILARGRRGRQHTADMDLSSGAREGVDTLFHRPDGMAAYQQDVGPHQPLPKIEMAGGSYWLVMRGGVVIDGRPCPAETCLWVGEAENRPEMIAGEDGATVAVLCFADRRGHAGRSAGA